MRKTIKGITYDTDNAIYLNEWWADAFIGAPDFWKEFLYKNFSPDGGFFIHGVGGIDTHYHGTEDIIPISRDLAQYWAMNHLSKLEYARIARYFMPEPQRLEAALE